MSDDLEKKPAESGGDEGMAVPVRRRRNTPTNPADARRNLVLVIGLVMAVVGIVAVVFIFMKDTSVYAKPVDELMQQKAQFLASSAHPARPVRVEGLLVHGTLERRDQPCEYRFHIEEHGTDIPVRYAQCVVPDTFRDVAGMEVGVTVEGELQADGSFEASSVLAKCPSKYEMQQRAAKGESMPMGDRPY